MPEFPGVKHEKVLGVQASSHDRRARSKNTAIWSFIQQPEPCATEGYIRVEKNLPPAFMPGMQNI